MKDDGAVMANLALVKMARDSFECAERDLDVAMVDAVRAGASLREVARAAGVSHVTVFRRLRQTVPPSNVRESAYDAPK